MRVQGALGWGAAAHSHQRPRSPDPAAQVSPPCTPSSPRGGTEHAISCRHHFMPANIWDRQIRTKLLGWAGRGPGRAWAEGPIRLHPCRGDGERWERELGLAAAALGLGRRGCYEKRGCSGSGFQGHVRTSDQGHDVHCPQRWLGTPGLPERPKAETFILALITAASCWHFGRLSHNADPSPAVPLCPGGPAAPFSLRELPLSTASPQRWQKIG